MKFLRSSIVTKTYLPRLDEVLAVVHSDVALVLHGEAREVDDGHRAIDLGQLVHEDSVQDAGERTEHVNLGVALV